jgi:DNA-binding response OmpR family regulator
MLPDIDGYEVLRRLRSARVNTPILILSASPSSTTRSRASASAPTTI